MYDVFDSFLSLETWHTGHYNDMERFYRALSQVVKRPEFDPETMGNHFREKKGVAPSDEEHPYFGEINDLVSNAWAVRDYMKATGDR